MLTPTNSFILLGVLASVSIFGENQSINATVRVRTDGNTDRAVARGTKGACPP